MNRLKNPDYYGFLDSLKDPIKGLELLVGSEVDIRPFNFTYVYAGLLKFLKINREVAIDFIPLITSLAISSGNKEVIVQTRRAYIHCAFKGYFKEHDALCLEIDRLSKVLKEYS